MVLVFDTTTAAQEIGKGCVVKTSFVENPGSRNLFS